MTTSSLLQPTFAAAIWPVPAGAAKRTRAVVLAVLGCLFVAACAQVQVPLWPVPVTGQTFAVLLVGLLYGWRLGAATLALYLLAGAAGLPVFAGFAAGYPVIAGPTGGYIAGFVLAAAVVGCLAGRGWDRHPLTTAAAMLAGNAVIYVPGLAWLTLFLAGSGAVPEGSSAFAAAVAGGLKPFLLGDAIKLALAAALMPAAWRLLARWRQDR